MEVRVEMELDEEIARDLEIKIMKSAEALRREGLVYLLEHLPYVTGDFLRSIAWEMEPTEWGVHTEIYSDPNKIKKPFYYPVIVEHGSRPHFVPLKELRSWAELKYGLKGKQAYNLAKRVQRGILKRGNIPYKHFKNTIDYLAQNCERIIRDVFENS